jgi:hydrogenase-4 component F
VCVAAGQAAFSADLLVLFGLLSMGFAAVFIIGQRDYKRMLAYSSVEHMGIAALGIGLGGAAGFGALLHVVNHSLAKGMLFLLAGNVLAAYRTRSSAEVTGLLRSLPVTGLLWLAGFLAITGSPPFGPFLSEFTILRGALAAGRPVVAGIYLVLLLVVFVAMAMIVPAMALGESSVARRREPWLAVLPPAVLGVAVLVMGVYVSPALAAVITRALGALRLP